jgi:hypothetical protein
MGFNKQPRQALNKAQPTACHGFKSLSWLVIETYGSKLSNALSAKIYSVYRPGVGNYFHLRATLGFYLCLAGQIQVKYAFSKLEMKPRRAKCGPRAVCCPVLV